MSKLALGIIETIGLPACIEAADVCMKSANINIIGYENSRGGGLITLKIEGDVGAVKAAIEAATVAANKVSKVYSSKVIARPSTQINPLITNNKTIGVEEPQVINNLEEQLNTQQHIKSEEESIDEYEENEIKKEEDSHEENEYNEKVIIYDVEDENQEEDSEIVQKKYTCNLCKDPNCTREKGDLRSNCINYKEDSK